MRMAYGSMVDLLFQGPQTNVRYCRSDILRYVLNPQIQARLPVCIYSSRVLINSWDKPSIRSRWTLIFRSQVSVDIISSWYRQVRCYGVTTTLKMKTAGGTNPGIQGPLSLDSLPSYS